MLERLEPKHLEEIAPYHEQVRELLVSDEVLAVTHWRTSFKKIRGVRLTEVSRLEAHSHILAGLIDERARDALAGADCRQLGYESLVRQAFLLGVADHVVDMALRMSMLQSTSIVLDRRLRVASTVGPGVALDEVLMMHEEFEAHARALRMSVGGVAKATQLLAVTRWDLDSRAVAKALRYRIPIVLRDDFLAAGMRDEIEARTIELPALRAAACRRCGAIHTFGGRQTHRLDAICSTCG